MNYCYLILLTTLLSLEMHDSFSMESSRSYFMNSRSPSKNQGVELDSPLRPSSTASSNYFESDEEDEADIIAQKEKAKKLFEKQENSKQGMGKTELKTFEVESDAEEHDTILQQTQEKLVKVGNTLARAGEDYIDSRFIAGLGTATLLSVIFGKIISVSNKNQQRRMAKREVLPDDSALAAKDEELNKLKQEISEQKSNTATIAELQTLLHSAQSATADKQSELAVAEEKRLDLEERMNALKNEKDELAVELEKQKKSLNEVQAEPDQQLKATIKQLQEKNAETLKQLHDAQEELATLQAKYLKAQEEVQEYKELSESLLGQMK